MLKLPLSILTLIASMHLCAQPLSELRLADPALHGCLQKQADKQGWTQSTDVVALKCHGKGITSGEGLTQLTALRSLSLYNNKLTELDVRQLKQLKSLNVANNQLNKLHISGLQQLQTLYAFRNRLEYLDLDGLRSVTKVRLMQNRLKQLDITPLKALQSGYLFDNKLEDLQITGLTELTFLDVKQNPMPDELYDFYDEQEGIVISHDGNADDWK